MEVEGLHVLEQFINDMNLRIAQLEAQVAWLIEYRHMPEVDVPSELEPGE